MKGCESAVVALRVETAAGDWQREVPWSFPMVFLGWNQQCLGFLRNEVSFGVKYARGLASPNCEMKERVLKALRHQRERVRTKSM